MSVIKAHVFLFCGLVVLAGRDSVRADAVTLNAERARQLVLYAPKPEYPVRARRNYETGAGVFLLNVDEKGVETSIKIEKTTGVWSLDVSCLKAFVKWRFKPHTVTKVRIPVTFVMKTFNMG
jgi:TonB family protein